MSQFFVDAQSAPPPLPPTVATSYVTDVNSPAIPAANVLDVIGGETTANNLFGIRTDGSSGGNVLTVQLTNRIQGFISTMDATPTTIINFPLGATPGVYKFDGSIEAFDTTDVAGACYGFQVGIRTTGAAATVIGVSFDDDFEEAAMVTADFTVTASGNNLLVQVIGIALKAIDWRALTSYRFVG